jgi:hypothetical protein
MKRIDAIQWFVSAGMFSSSTSSHQAVVSQQNNSNHNDSNNENNKTTMMKKKKLTFLEKSKLKKEGKSLGELSSNSLIVNNVIKKYERGYLIRGASQLKRRQHARDWLFKLTHKHRVYLAHRDLKQHAVDNALFDIRFLFCSLFSLSLYLFIYFLADSLLSLSPPSPTPLTYRLFTYLHTFICLLHISYLHHFYHTSWRLLHSEQVMKRRSAFDYLRARVYLLKQCSYSPFQSKNESNATRSLIEMENNSTLFSSGYAREVSLAKHFLKRTLAHASRMRSIDRLSQL